MDLARIFSQYQPHTPWHSQFSNTTYILKPKIKTIFSTPWLSIQLPYTIAHDSVRIFIIKNSYSYLVKNWYIARITILNIHIISVETGSTEYLDLLL